MEHKISLSAVTIFPVFWLTFSIYPLVSSAACTCEAEEQEVNFKQTHQALTYKIIAVVSILFASAVGVCIPVIGNRVIPALRSDGNIFSLIKAFAAGVLLSTGFIHILPDSVDDLASPCLNEKPWGDFPLAYCIAMSSAMFTMMAESFFTSFFRRKDSKDKEADGQTTQPRGRDVESGVQSQVQVHTHATHGHAHGSLSSEDMLLRHKIITHVLELGILAHSIIIGIAVGVSHDPSTIKPLIAALTFHQLFEGMGGGCLTRAEFSRKAVAWMSVCYSLTTPIGIGIGMGVARSYSGTSSSALMVQGSMNAASAGILIYMAFVDLLAPVFMDHKLQDNRKLHLGSVVSLFLGAGSMSVIALWA